jgi:hypothetical protein
MAITNPANIPAAQKPHVKAACEAIGPVLLTDRYPKDAAGQPKATLTNAEVGEVFEAITREFWRQQIQGVRANAAAEAARLAAVAAHAADPFA